MKEVRHHSSVVLVESASSSEFLLGLYDNTYPLVDFRNKLNFFGGNSEKGDRSPLGILERELTEEFSTVNPRLEGIDFAPTEDIIKIRDSILDNAESFQDYFAKVIKNETEEFYALYSVFKSKVPDEIIFLAKTCIAAGKRLTGEGGGEKVISLEQIKDGKLRFASSVGQVIEDYTGFPQEKSKTYFLEKIGKPRCTLRDYMPQYSYEFMK